MDNAPPFRAVSPDAGFERAPSAVIKPIIIGAGVAGLASAIFLARKGLKPTVLERRNELPSAGAGIQIPPNASHVLRYLGVLEEVVGLPSGSIADAAETLDFKDGRLLVRRPLSKFEDIYGAPWVFVHRGEYIRILYDTAVREGVDVRFGESTESVREDLPAVRLSNGSWLMGDVILVCDGINSSSRSSVCRDLLHESKNEAISSGHIVHRATISRSAVQGIGEPSLDKILELTQRKCHIWVGPHAHVVFYPIGDAAFNLVVVVDERVLSARLQRDRLRLEKLFATWNPTIRVIVRAALAECPVQFLEESRLKHLPRPLPTWISGKAVLLGDACHPTLPYLAQGAALALEDAAMLGTLLGVLADVLRAESTSQPRAPQESICKAGDVHQHSIHVGSRDGDTPRHSSSINIPREEGIRTALKWYEKVQKERAEEIVYYSEVNGRENHAGPEDRARRDVGFRMYMEGKLVEGDAGSSTGTPWIRGDLNRRMLGRRTVDDAMGVVEDMKKDLREVLRRAGFVLGDLLFLEESGEEGSGDGGHSSSWVETS